MSDTQNVEGGERYSYAEVMVRLFPNSILTRMHEKLAEWMGLNHETYGSLDTEKNDKRLGFVSIPNARQKTFDGLREWLPGFYRSEGYRVEITKRGVIATNPKGEVFEVTANKTENSLFVRVQKINKPR